jgi:hypothetical protein
MVITSRRYDPVVMVLSMFRQCRVVNTLLGIGLQELGGAAIQVGNWTGRCLALKDMRCHPSDILIPRFGSMSKNLGPANQPQQRSKRPWIVRRLQEEQSV